MPVFLITSDPKWLYLYALCAVSKRASKYLFFLANVSLYGLIPAIGISYFSTRIRRVPVFKGSFKSGEVVLFSHLIGYWIKRCTVGWFGGWGRAGWAVFNGLLMDSPQTAASSLLYFALKRENLMKLYELIWQERFRLALYWPVMLLLLLAGSVWLQKHSNNTLRKFYHFASVAMFLPALLWNPELLKIALAVAGALLFGVEWLRVRGGKSGKWPQLDAFMVRCRNAQRDTGIFTLSHIYLLLGCAIPVWMGHTLEEQSAGIISLGLGDSMASIYGQKFGIWRLKNGKTADGFLAGSLAMYLAFTGIFSSTWKALFVAVIAGLWELFIDFNDNLTMPMITMLSIRHFPF